MFFQQVLACPNAMEIFECIYLVVFCSLEKKLDRRADYNQLLTHPFLSSASSIDVANFVSEMIDLKKCSKE